MTIDLPTVTHLHHLWEDLAKKPLWRPPYTWNYIKLSRKIDIKFMAIKKFKDLTIPGKINHCYECTDNCCIGKRSTVSLRFADIATLIDLQETIYINTTKPTFSKEELSKNEALQATVNSEAWNMFPTIKQNSFFACQALGLDGLCKLYPYWPLSCKRFPFSIHVDSKEIFYSSRCPSYQINPSQHTQAIQNMKQAALEAYNARIKDLVMLAYIPEELGRLGLLQWITTHR